MVISRRMLRSALIALQAGVFCIGAMPIHAQNQFSTLIPADAEFAATLNVAALVDTGLMRSAMDTFGNSQIEAMINLLKNLSGIDIWNKDLQQVHIFGQIDKQETIIASFEGNLDKQKLLDLIKLNEQFKEVTIAGMPGYEWFDRREKILKCGLFTPTGSALIANSQAALAAALSPQSAAAPSVLRSEWSKLEQNLTPGSGFWGCVVVPQHLDLTKFPAARDIQSFTLQVDLTAADVTSILTARFAKADNTPQWLDLAKGGMAVLALQQNAPTLAVLARKARVEQTPDGMAIASRVSADVATLITLKNELKAMKRANP